MTEEDIERRKDGSIAVERLSVAGLTEMLLSMCTETRNLVCGQKPVLAAVERKMRDLRRQALGAYYRACQICGDAESSLNGQYTSTDGRPIATLLATGHVASVLKCASRLQDHVFDLIRAWQKEEFAGGNKTHVAILHRLDQVEQWLGFARLIGQSCALFLPTLPVSCSCGNDDTGDSH